MSQIKTHERNKLPHKSPNKQEKPTAREQLVRFFSSVLSCICVTAVYITRCRHHYRVALDQNWRRKVWRRPRDSNARPFNDWIQAICARIARAACTLARASTQRIVALVELYQCAKFGVARSAFTGLRAFFVKSVFRLWHAQLAHFGGRSPKGSWFTTGGI